MSRIIGASSGANSFQILFGMLPGPTALEILREDRDLRTSLSKTRYSCGTDTGEARHLDVDEQSDQ